MCPGRQVSSDANSRRMLRSSCLDLRNERPVRLTRMYTMYAIRDSTESKPATPKIYEKSVRKKPQTLSLPFLGAHSYASPLKSFIRPLDYYFCGHEASTISTASMPDKAVQLETTENTVQPLGRNACLIIPRSK